MHYILLFLAVLVSHGLLFSSTNQYWDGWYIFEWVRTKNLPLLEQYFAEAGHNAFGWMHNLYAQFPNPVPVYHIVAFTCWFLIACGCYLMLRRTGKFTANESLWLGAFTAIYPGFVYDTDVTVSQFLQCWALFLFSAARALKVRQKHSVFIDPLALIGFFASFIMNSLLVLFHAFMFGMLILFREDEKKPWNLATIWQFVRRNFLLIILPYAFWAVKMIFDTRNSMHKDYYHMTFVADATFEQLTTVWHELVKVQLADAAHSVGTTGSAVLALLFAFFAYSIWRDKIPTFWPRLQKKFGVLAFGLLALFTAAWPYAVVRQGFGTYGWTTKNNLLLSLPLGLIFLGIARIVFADMRRARWLAGIVLFFCALGCIRNNIYREAWEALRISMRQQVSRVYAAEPFSIAHIQNDVHVDHENRNFPCVIWSLVLRDKNTGPFFATEDKPATDAGYYLADEYAKTVGALFIPYLFDDVKPEGKQVALHFTSTADLSEWPLGWRALAVKLGIGDKAENQKFIDNLVQLEVKKLFPKEP